MGLLEDLFNGEVMFRKWWAAALNSLNCSGTFLVPDIKKYTF